MASFEDVGESRTGVVLGDENMPLAEKEPFSPGRQSRGQVLITTTPTRLASLEQAQAHDIMA